MKKEDFFEVLGELDDDIVKGAKTSMKKKRNWKVWGAMVACLAVVIMAGSIIPQVIPTETDPQGNENMIETGKFNIYYLSERGTIENKSMEVRCTAEDIFNEWAILNNISDVVFVNCVYDDGGSEKLQGDVMEYIVGNRLTLNLTVSAEFSAYAESEQGDLLIQSLRQTFCDYISVDDFNLIIDN